MSRSWLLIDATIIALVRITIEHKISNAFEAFTYSGNCLICDVHKARNRVEIYDTFLFCRFIFSIYLTKINTLLILYVHSIFLVFIVGIVIFLPLFTFLDVDNWLNLICLILIRFLLGRMKLMLNSPKLRGRTFPIIDFRLSIALISRFYLFDGAIGFCNRWLSDWNDVGLILFFTSSDGRLLLTRFPIWRLDEGCRFVL